MNDTNTFRLLAALTTLLGGLPFLLYGRERLFAGLPARAEWFRVNPATGFVVTNHGPWYDTWEGAVVFLSMLLLVVTLLASLLLFLYTALNRPRWSTLTSRAALIGTQASTLAAQAVLLAWTID